MNSFMTYQQIDEKEWEYLEQQKIMQEIMDLENYEKDMENMKDDFPTETAVNQMYKEWCGL